MPVPGSTAAAPAPRVVQDRVPSVGVRLVALCPRMDLVALVLDGNTLAVQRVSWQRLATLAPRGGGDVTALAWSPAGAALAVGSDAGDAWIVRVDPASARSRPSRPAPTARVPHPVSALHWAAASCVQPAAYYDRDADEVDPNGLIAVGDANGGVSLYSFELEVKIAHVHVLPPGTAVSRLHFTSDTMGMFVAGANEREATLQCVSLSPLASKRAEVFRTGTEAVVVTGILEELRESEEAFKKSWLHGIVQTLEKSIRIPMEKLIFDFAEGNADDPWRVLYDAYCGGGQPGSLEQFLGSDLTARGVKDLVRSISTSSGEACGAIERALPLAERLLFRASEYRGLARCKSRFGAIGLTVTAVDALFDAAADVLDVLSSLRAEIEDASSEIQGFLEWMMCAARQASGSNPDYESASENLSQAGAFLKGMLQQENRSSAMHRVMSLHESFAKKEFSALSEAAAFVLNLCSENMSTSLASALSLHPEYALSFPLQKEAAAFSITIAFESSVGEIRSRFACQLNSSNILIAEFRVASLNCFSSSSTGAVWSWAQLECNERAPKVVSVSLKDFRTLALVEVTSRSVDDKCPFSLTLRPLDAVAMSETKDVPLPPPQSLASSTLCRLEICNAPAKSACVLSCEFGRDLASVLVASRRVVLIGLQDDIADPAAT